MYLSELFIKNNGPIRDLHLELSFQDGRPIPCVIVGRNGTGKTNLLSIAADALMQAASAHFNDVLTQSGLGRSYFRILGGKTVSAGESLAVSIVRFQRGEKGNVFFHEKVGKLSPVDAKTMLPESLIDGAVWPDDENSSKDINLSLKDAEDVFTSGVYCYFPASRSEQPFWFNSASIDRNDEFDVRDRFTNVLGRPLFVEQGLDGLTQWLLGVLTESRLQVTNAKFAPETNQQEVDVRLNFAPYMRTQLPLIWANNILSAITDDPEAHFFWAGRHNPKKVGISLGGRQLHSGLNALSGGQATLLAMFGTLLRYADAVGCGPEEAEGIVLIDELDAHMHIELQIKALPELISLFPKIQFLITSHSPFFSLGMERKLSASGVRFIELPTGNAVNAEAYAEFQNALDAFRDTKHFSSAIEEAVRSSEKPLVLLAGETDSPYFKAAAHALEYHHLEDVFEWIGQPGGSGGGTFTGDPSLDKAVAFLKANPNVTKRTVIVLYDCDAKKVDETVGSLHVIGIPQIENDVAKKGIENLLPSSVFTEEMYSVKEFPADYGETRIHRNLDKMKLCRSLTEPGVDPAIFANFRPLLERIDRIVAPSKRAPDDDLNETDGSRMQPEPA
ncbi:AAA family ATPase [Rhodococcus hoagii]|nr:AAA family ATPase [Prescottella equi]